MIELNGRTAFGTALLAGGTIVMAVHADTIAAKAEIVAGGVAVFIISVWASRLRAPSPETIEHVVHERVVPAALLLVLVAMMAGITWQLYQG